MTQPTLDQDTPPAEPMPELLHGDARNLQLPDDSVDLIVTSPPYFGLRDYGTDGQLGAEPTPAEYIKALIECTAEMVRVLKPAGSIFVNLGDKYAGGGGGNYGGDRKRGAAKDGAAHPANIYNRPAWLEAAGIRAKSLMLLPERYRIAAVDELGLIARAVIVWAKPNGLPESVTDRVRRSHEDWVHLTKSPRYFAAIDEIREPYEASTLARAHLGRKTTDKYAGFTTTDGGKPTGATTSDSYANNPLGKLPGSVWNIPTQPLRVPAELGVDHFAAFPMEWPRRLILGWSPREVCTACGEGRRPVTDVARVADRPGRVQGRDVDALLGGHGDDGRAGSRYARTSTITGYACACPAPTIPVTIREFDDGRDEMVERVVQRPDPDWQNPAPTTPGVVLDPFGGTGTTALVAAMNGRRGISVDLSDDYQRLAAWRAQDPKQRAKAGAA